MAKSWWTIAACATLLSAGMAMATVAPTAQQACYYEQITAWKTYQSCMDGVVARDAKGASFDEFKALWQCRHAYFKKWTTFQTKRSLVGSSCQPVGGARFADNGDGTVTDNLSGLVWELKTSDSSVHKGSNLYTWSTGSNAEDGTAFTNFLTAGLNTPGFAGGNGWRLPTLAELQTILVDFACTGGGGGSKCICTSPCVAFSDGNTQGYTYWSATSYVPIPGNAWLVDFYNGFVFNNINLNSKTFSSYVRAVRGGL